MLLTCSRNTSLLWVAWEFSAETTQSAIQKLILWQWAVTRLTHVPWKTPELGIFCTGKQTNSKTCLEIFMIENFGKFSSAENLGIQNMPQIVTVCNSYIKSAPWLGQNLCRENKLYFHWCHEGFEIFVEVGKTDINGQSSMGFNICKRLCNQSLRELQS